MKVQTWENYLQADLDLTWYVFIVWQPIHMNLFSHYFLLKDGLSRKTSFWMKDGNRWAPLASSFPLVEVTLGNRDQGAPRKVRWCQEYTVTDISGVYIRCNSIT